MRKSPRSEPQQPVDAFGHVAQGKAVHAFGGSRIAMIESLAAIKKARARVVALQGREATRCLRDMREYEVSCRNAENILLHAIPYAVCTVCDGKGCARCREAGWLTRQQYARLNGE